MKAFIIAAIIVFIIIVIGCHTYHSRVSDDYLYGFWVAEDDEFCESAGIDSLMIFIGEPERGVFTTTRNCYIIIMNDMCNQGFTLSYRRASPSANVFSATATFDDEQIWGDGDMRVKVDMTDGTMRITGADGTVYARVVKQHETTNITRALLDADMAV